MFLQYMYGHLLIFSCGMSTNPSVCFHPVGRALRLYADRHMEFTRGQAVSQGLTVRVVAGRSCANGDQMFYSDRFYPSFVFLRPSFLLCFYDFSFSACSFASPSSSSLSLIPSSSYCSSPSPFCCS